MANQTIRTLGTSADGKTLTLLGQTQFYPFPYEGAPLWATPTDLAASEARILAAIASIGGVSAGAPQGQPLPTPTPTPTPTPAPAPSTLQMAIAVGPTRAFTEPADAAPYLAPGGTMTLDDGVYRKSFHTDTDAITIKSAGGNPFRCYFDGQGGIGGGHRLTWGKGMIHTTRSINLFGIGFRNCGSPASGDNYSNEAGLWIGDSGGAGYQYTGTVQRCAFDNNANGIFTAANEWTLSMVVKECIFGFLAPNGMNACVGGGGAHPAHDMYLQCGSCEVTGGYFYGCCNGHNVKSRCKTTVVHDNPLLTQDGGRVLDVPDGGAVTFAGNTVLTRKDRAALTPNGQAVAFGNANMIGYCDETAANGSTGCSLTGNTFQVSRGNSVIWAANGSRITGSGNTVNFFEEGGLILQGSVSGVTDGSAPGGKGPAAPSLPPPPAWAVV